MKNPDVDPGRSEALSVVLGEEVWRVVDASFDAVHLLSPDGEILYASSPPEGEADGEPEATGRRDFLSLIHPKDRPAVVTHLRAACATPGVPVRLRALMRGDDAAWVLVQHELTGVTGLAPEPVLVVVGRQVSSRAALSTAFRNLTQALDTLVAGDDAIVHARDEVSLVEEMCRVIVEKGGYRFAWVGYAVDDDAKSVRPVAQWGASGHYPVTVTVTWADDDPSSAGPGGTAIKTGRPAIIDDMLAEPRYARWRDQAIVYGHRSGLAVPLRVHGKVIGFLGIYSALPAAFDEAAVVQLCRLGEHLGFGIERQRDAVRLAESMRGTVRDLQQRQHIADELRRELEKAIIGIGERINAVVGSEELGVESAKPLIEARQMAARAAETAPAADLGPRLTEILRLVAEGFTNREIAETLHLSEHTIKSHLQTIYTKLSVRNRVEAAMAVANRRVADPDSLA